MRNCAENFQPIHTTGNSTPDNQGALPNIRKRILTYDIHPSHKPGKTRVSKTSAY
jgi:hypothetical protein